MILGLQADRVLAAEQGPRDFRPPEDGEAPPLDRPTQVGAPDQAPFIAIKAVLLRGVHDFRLQGPP